MSYGTRVQTERLINWIYEKIRNGEFEGSEEKQNAKQLIIDIINAYQSELSRPYNEERKTKLTVFRRYIELFFKDVNFQQYNGKFHPFFGENWRQMISKDYRNKVRRVGFNLQGEFVIEMK